MLDLSLPLPGLMLNLRRWITWRLSNCAGLTPQTSWLSRHRQRGWRRSASWLDPDFVFRRERRRRKRRGVGAEAISERWYCLCVGPPGHALRPYQVLFVWRSVDPSGNVLKGQWAYNLAPVPVVPLNALDLGHRFPVRPQQAQQAAGEVSRVSVSRQICRATSGCVSDRACLVWTYRFWIRRPLRPLPFCCLLRQLAPLERSQAQHGAGRLGVGELGKPIALGGFAQTFFTGFHVPPAGGQYRCLATTLHAPKVNLKDLTSERSVGDIAGAHEAVIDVAPAAAVPAAGAPARY
jgi:hypothetical protein